MIYYKVKCKYSLVEGINERTQKESGKISVPVFMTAKHRTNCSFIIMMKQRLKL